MDKALHATYEHGVLKLDSPLALPDHSRVSLFVFSNNQAVKPEVAEDEFDQMLNEFSFSGRKPLPGDFSRADIYSDHD